MPEIFDVKEEEIKTGLSFSVRNADATDFEPDDETAETGEDDDSEGEGADYDQGMEILDVVMYGEIGEHDYMGQISSKAFSDNLSKHPKAGAINLMINSVGGDVFEAQAIHAQLKRHKAKKTAHIDGLCASSATLIAAACDDVNMSTGSMYMIHNAWTVAQGDYRDMAKASDTLKAVNETIVSVYKDKTGLPVDEIRNMMDEETWMSAAKAKKMGFASSTKGKVKGMAIVDNQLICNGINFGVNHFKKLPPRIQKLENSVKPELVEKPKIKEMTPEDIKAQVDAARHEAVASERARISELSELEAPETLAIVAEAKTSGKTASQIMKACIEALKARKTEVVAEDKAGKEYLAKAEKAGIQSLTVNSGDNSLVKPEVKGKMIEAAGQIMSVEDFHKKFAEANVSVNGSRANAAYSVK